MRRSAAVFEFCKRLDTPIGEGGRMLSGGQRQRIGLARALYGTPRLVVLDEPNASLDDAGDRALFQAVYSLKKQGTTVVLISHRAQVMALMDRILALKQGRVAYLQVAENKQLPQNHESGETVPLLSPS
jgi:ATP-binding cassette subfamily C exporter for protease/lipase